MKNAYATPVVITFAQAEKRFGKQVLSEPVLGQRAHAARAEAGRAKHVGYAPQFGNELKCVELYVGRRKHRTDLVDGGQRLLEWIIKGACPYKELVLMTAKVTGATVAEAEDKAARENRTVDSVLARRSARDYYTSAIVKSGMEVKSKGYRDGARSVRMFRRALGPAFPGSTSADRDLVEAVKAEQSVHRLMDELFMMAESEHLMTRRQANTLFSAGAQVGIFNFLRGRTVTGHLRQQFADAFLHAARRPTGTKKLLDPVSIIISKALLKVCNEANYQAISLLNYHSDKVVDLVGEQLKKALAPAARKLPAVKSVKTAAV